MNDCKTTQCEVNKLMKNRRYESFQISRCDSKSNRSCIKNQMMMWWDEIQLINQMIRSSDLLIFFEKTNFSNRFSIRYFINSSHHLNFYHCIALSIYLSTIFIISSSRYKTIKCLISSIINIQHSLFDFIRCEKAIIRERIHQKSHLLIRITFHWWRRTVDFTFLYLKNWLLHFRRIFSRKDWNERILKSTTIYSLRFRYFFHFFCYFIFSSLSFSHNHFFRINALFICSDWFFRFRSHFFWFHLFKDV